MSGTTGTTNQSAESEHPFRGLEDGWVRVPRAPRRSGVETVDKHAAGACPSGAPRAPL